MCPVYCIYCIDPVTVMCVFYSDETNSVLYCIPITITQPVQILRNGYTVLNVIVVSTNVKDELESFLHCRSS